AESTAKYFKTTLPGIGAERMGGPNKDARLAELKAASTAAADAYIKMRNAVAALYFTDASAKTLKPEFDKDRYALGEAEYNWALKNNLRLDKPAAQLYDESWAVVQTTRQQMTALAREIGVAHKWTLPADDGAAVRFVFDELSKDYPKSDTEMIAWYRDAAFRLVAF